MHALLVALALAGCAPAPAPAAPVRPLAPRPDGRGGFYALVEVLTRMEWAEVPDARPPTVGGEEYVLAVVEPTRDSPTRVRLGGEGVRLGLWVADLFVAHLTPRAAPVASAPRQQALLHGCRDDVLWIDGAIAAARGGPALLPVDPDVAPARLADVARRGWPSRETPVAAHGTPGRRLDVAAAAGQRRLVVVTPGRAPRIVRPLYQYADPPESRFGRAHLSIVEHLDPSRLESWTLHGNGIAPRTPCLELPGLQGDLQVSQGP